MGPRAIRGFTPMATNTCEGSGESVVQAEPVAAQMLRGSGCSRIDSPSTDRKLMFEVLATRAAPTE